MSYALNNKNLIANIFCKLFINAENYAVFYWTFSYLLTDFSVILRNYNLSVAIKIIILPHIRPFFFVYISHFRFIVTRNQYKVARAGFFFWKVLHIASMWSGQILN